MWKSFACGVVGAASVVAPVLAQEVVEDRIIQVAPDRDVVELQRTEVAPVSAYWIGLMGGPVTDELRAHLELPADKGILVREVVPDSPAAKAGIQQYDILLRIGDDELSGMQDLVKHVTKAGEAEGKVELELIRHGRQESATVAPEKRPEGQASWVTPEGGLSEFNIRIPGPEGGEPGAGAPGVFQFRNFGPDVLIGQPFAGGKLPDGVSVTVKREGDKPAEVTIKRGDETWTVKGDDPKSLEQVPEDLRPMVGNLMSGGNAMFRREMIPLPPNAEFQPFGGNLQQRLDAMERQMRELEERLGEREEN